MLFKETQDRGLPDSREHFRDDRSHLDITELRALTRIKLYTDHLLDDCGRIQLLAITLALLCRLVLFLV